MIYMAVTAKSVKFFEELLCFKMLTFSADYPKMEATIQDEVDLKWCDFEGHVPGDILAGSYGSEYNDYWSECGSTASDKPGETTWRIYTL